MEATVTVRPADTMDIPVIVNLAAEAHKRSKLAHLEVDTDYFMSLLSGAIANHGEYAVCFVVEDRRRVKGVLIGVVQRLYWTKKLEATDYWFYVTKGAQPSCARLLASKFIRWARNLGYGVCMGVSDIVLDEPERIGKMYNRMGLRKNGYMYTIDE